MKAVGKGSEFKVGLVEKESPFYPAALLEEPWASSTPGLWALGNLEILRKPLLGFICSVRCPGEAILRTYDAARTLRDAGIAVIGGFHSPMEKECLAMLLKGTQPVVICPARSVQSMRIPGLWRRPLEGGRLLVLSFFRPEENRMTADLAVRRNQFVRDMVQALLIAYAASGSHTENLALTARLSGKKVMCLSEARNTNLVAAGAEVCAPADLERKWKQFRRG